MFPSFRYFVLLLALPCTTLDAGLILEFNLGGTPTSAFEIPSTGGTVPVQVYLRQTAGTTTLSNEGLISAGIRLTIGTGSIANVQSVANIQENTSFDDSMALFKARTSSTADLNEFVGLSSPTVFPSMGDPNRILLGTFTFTGLNGGISMISVADLDPTMGADDIISGLGTVLDSQVTSGNASIAVNPEPSSFALSIVFTAICGLRVYWRRRRRGTDK
jgi:hypothetical protein